MLLITSCDDGDIVVNDFEFDQNRLNFCNIEGQNSANESVLFNINTQNEAIAINQNNIFTDTDFELEEEIITRNIPSEAQVFYRKFNSPITNDYFCSTIPLNNVGIQTELIADRGMVIITKRRILDLRPEGDVDADGVTNQEEGYKAVLAGDETLQDTDKDGVPDYLDEDDDNDNVPTRIEIRNVNNEIERPFINTDRIKEIKKKFDLLPDYLDDDDDGDSIPTRNEIKVNDSLPRNKFISGTDSEIRVYAYLDSIQKDSIPNKIFLKNTIKVTYNTTVNIKNLGLSNGESSVIREDLEVGVINRANQDETSKTPFAIEQEKKDKDKDNQPDPQN